MFEGEQGVQKRVDFSPLIVYCFRALYQGGDDLNIVQMVVLDHHQGGDEGLSVFFPQQTKQFGLKVRTAYQQFLREGACAMPESGEFDEAVEGRFSSQAQSIPDFRKMAQRFGQVMRWRRFRHADFPQAVLQRKTGLQFADFGFNA